MTDSRKKLAGHTGSFMILLAATGMIFLVSCNSHDDVETRESVSELASTEIGDTEADYDAENEIIWLIPTYATLPSDDAMSEINQFLSEQGIDKKLRFCLIESYDQTYADNIAQWETENGIPDIVNSGLWYDCTGGMDFVSSGRFVQLDSLFSTEDGSLIQAAVPEECWDVTLVDGVHYTIPGMVNDANQRSYIAVASELINQSEDITISNMDQLLGEGHIYAETDINLLVSFSDYCLYGANLFDLASGSFVSIADAVSLQQDLDTMTDLFASGKLLLADDPDNPDAEVDIDWDDCDIYIGRGDVRETLQERDYTIIWSDYDPVFSGIGVTNGIWSESSKQEEALKVLALVYSQPELANLIVYGTEDEYQLTDGYVTLEENNPDPISRQTYLGLYDYVYPLEGEQYTSRYENRLAHISSEMFQYASVNMDLIEKNDEVVADQSRLYDWLESWYKEK